MGWWTFWIWRCLHQWKSCSWKNRNEVWHTSRNYNYGFPTERKINTRPDLCALWLPVTAALCISVGNNTMELICTALIQRSPSVGLNSWPLRTYVTARTGETETSLQFHVVMATVSGSRAAACSGHPEKSETMPALTSVWQLLWATVAQVKNLWRLCQACRHRTELGAISRIQLDILGHNVCHIPPSFFGCESAMQKTFGREVFLSFNFATFLGCTTK